jgi:hypothetical protein
VAMKLNFSLDVSSLPQFGQLVDSASSFGYQINPQALQTL